MPLPYFYAPEMDGAVDVVTLSEESSKHIVQVLRMQKGEAISLTNGTGALATAIIEDDHKKKCKVRIQDIMHTTPALPRYAIAISLLKNSSRFEWFLEKATELGIHTIVPLICKRTEKQHFRADRMKGILVSAMLQSRQFFLPELQEPIRFSAFINGEDFPGVFRGRFIAHCEEEEQEKPLLPQLVKPVENTIVLIGPEGDFAPEEITQAYAQGFRAVSLGQTRLRTETAGMAAAVSLVMQTTN